ncbi:MAG: iron ABC transporter permease [Clostridiaceae bacterium]|nr:iron ABC transporter permease [Clostridiaceae bacterium]
MTPGKAAQRKRRLIVLTLGITLIAAFLISVCVGRYSISPAEAIKIIFAFVTRNTAGIDPVKLSIVINVRLPRIIMGMIIGAGLSLSGTSYQGIFGNPLVSPDILGVSSGAGFGAALGILIGVGSVLIQGLSLFFGLLSVLIVLVLSRVRKKTELFTLVLSGVIVRSLFDALVSLIKYVADPQDKLPAIVIWLMGSLASSSYKDVTISALIILPCIILMIIMRWQMNLLSLDEEEARSLGVNVSRMRKIIIAISTLITAVSVSTCGIIGWVGLVIPHVGRILVGSDHRVLMPASALLGAIYLLFVDGLARTMTAAEIPLSILTAIIGAPFFAYMLRKTVGGNL